MQSFFLPFNNQKGFTLTEAMVVVSIAAIMMGFGYSGFSSWQKKEEVRGATYQLAGMIKEARMAAIEKHKEYKIIYTDNATSEGNGILTLSTDNGTTELRKMILDSNISIQAIKDPNIIPLDITFSNKGIIEDSKSIDNVTLNNNYRECWLTVSRLGNTSMGCTGY